MLGDGVVAHVFLLNKQVDNMMITTGWGLAVVLAVYLCGRLSGGHINPAVTLALCSRGEFPRLRVFPLLGAQLAGLLGARSWSTLFTPRHFKHSSATPA